jgi:galactose mutarotase-like enzyme
MSHPALTLKTQSLSVTLQPERGGKMTELLDLATGKNWLWTSQQEPPGGASFDENWVGGWEEMFPNDAAGSLDGQPLRDHGELWNGAWTVVEKEPTGVRMAYVCQSVPVRIEKSVQLATDAPRMRVAYRLSNLSDRLVPFHLKLHPALHVEAGDEILLPDCWIEPVDLGFSTRIGREGKTRFPQAIDREGKTVSLHRALPPQAAVREFFYASDLAEGWCGLRSESTGRTLRFRFRNSDFPYVWIFQSYGGWNKRQVLMLEPCTDSHYDLEKTHNDGRAAVLKPREVREMIVHVELESSA